MHLTVSHLGELFPAESAASARWVVARVHGFALNVGSLIPSGFDSYARVLHPAYRHSGATATSDGIAVPWAEVAKANRTVLHSEAQFTALVGHADLSEHDQPGLWDTPPANGSLAADMTDVLSLILGHHTATPSTCWFAVWEGWGNLTGPATRTPTLELPGRQYLLYKGPVSAASRSLGAALSEHRSANLWWPDGQEWCVATEVDLDSTYVGGSEACIADLLTSPLLEVLPARLTDGITLHSDKVNPSPVE